MENFKKKKTAHSRSFVDGIKTPGVGTKGFGSASRQKDTTVKLGDFSRPDGFHPAQQSVINTGGAAAVVPVAPVIDPLLLPDEPRGRSKLKHKRSWKKIAKRASLALTSLVLLVGIFFAVKIFVIERKVLKGGGKAPALSEKIDISQLKGEGDGRINILLLGTGGPGHDGPDLTDTILLASIDPINKQAALLSIPRDLWVKIPNNGYQKLNAAYAYGKQQSHAKDEAGKDQDGINLVDSTLEPIIGIPIHYHVVVDFQAFKQAVNAVGGVSIDVPEQLYDPTIAWENHNSAIIAQKGQQTMYGDQALLYARSRETSTDFARAQRQRALIVALKDKAFSVSTFTNPLKISQLLSSFGDNVHSDFTINDIMRLRQIGSTIPSNSITSLDLVTSPHDLLTTGDINGLSTVQPKAGLFVYSDIQNYVRNALKDGFIQKENANITILNGTNTPGLATKKATELKSYGYNVNTVGDAPTKNYTNTTLVALKDGSKKYTQHYLEERLKVTAVTKVPDSTISVGSADFVIILGQNDSSN